MFKKVIFSLFVCAALCTQQSTSDLTGFNTSSAILPLAHAQVEIPTDALGNSVGAASPEADAAKEGSKTPSTSDSCGLSNIAGCFSKVISTLINVTLTQITGFILYLSGALLDYSIHFSVVAFSDFVSTTQGSGVYSAWKIIRNLFNIIVVFTLLKLSIQKILSGVDIPLIGSFSPTQLKRVLMSLVVFTLLVNFSFFFTKALIDVSNIFTLQFYAATGATPKASVKDAFNNTGLSAQVMTALGLQGIVAKRGEMSGVNDATTGSSTLGAINTETVSGALLANIFIIIAAFVFLQAAFLFALRMVALVILLFGSPLMFAKGVVGFLDQWSNKWWKLFWEQLFVAPLFMLMLFMTLYVGNGVGRTIALSAGEGSFFGNVFTFIVMTLLLLSCIKISKTFGGYAANKATSFGADVFGSLIAGGAGSLGRSTVGRYASHVGTTDSWLGNKLRSAATGAGAGGAFARSTLQLADYTAKQNFDVRNSAGVQGTLQKFSGEKLGGTAEKRDFVTLREQEVTDQKNMVKERRESVGARWEGAKRDASTGKYQALKFDEKGNAVGYASGYIDDIFKRQAGETEGDFRTRMSKEAKDSTQKLDEIAKALQDSNLSQERRASLQSEKQQAMQKAAYKDFDSKKSLEENVKKAFDAGEEARKKAVVTNYQQTRTTTEKVVVAAQATKDAAKAAVNSTPRAFLGDAVAAAKKRTEEGDARAGKNDRAVDGSYRQADIRNKVASEYEKAEKKAAEAEAKKARVEAIKKKEIETFNKTYEEYAEKLGKDKAVKEKENIPEIVETMNDEIKGLEAEVEKLKKSSTKDSTSTILGADGKPAASTKTPEEIKKQNDDLVEIKRKLQAKRNARDMMKESSKMKHISESAGWTLSDDGAK